MMSFDRRAAPLALLGTIADTMTSSAIAQTFPSKPVELVAAFPEGASATSLREPISEKLTSALGQPVTVENRPGSAGSTGASSAVRAKPDSYTTLLAGPFWPGKQWKSSLTGSLRRMGGVFTSDLA